MSNPIDRFNEIAGEYDEFTDSMPNFDEMNETTLEIFEHWFESRPSGSICELGSGTGTMARTIVDTFQPERYLALDGAEKMVEQTIKAFTDYTGPTHVRFEVQRFESWEPRESFDCLYSSLSIHHLKHRAKRRLFKRIQKSLNENGLFFYADIFSPLEDLSQFYFKIHKHRRLKSGMSEEEFQKRWQSHLENDIPSEWNNTVSWLNKAGFESVDCVWKNMNRAILLALK